MSDYREFRFLATKKDLLRFLKSAHLLGDDYRAKALEDIAEVEDSQHGIHGIVALPPREGFRYYSSVASRFKYPRPSYLSDVVPYEFYDTISISDTPPRIQRGRWGGLYGFNFFSHCVGPHPDVEGVSPVRPIWITNLLYPNWTGGPDMFQLERMWVNIAGPQAAAEEFAMTASLELWLGPKSHALLPMADLFRWKSGFDHTGHTQEGSTVQCRSFDPPFCLPSRCRFSVSMESKNMWSDLTIQVVLDGLLARTVS